MPTIVEVNNPFEPHRKKLHTVEAGSTFRDWLDEVYPDWTKWQNPTVVTIGGEGLFLEEYNTYRIREDDVLNVVTLQGWVAVPYLLAALVVTSVVIALNMPKPATPGQEPEPDPVYDLKGQANQNRFGNPIESAYGRNRMWPSIAARPYNKYINNDQYLYQLFCLGHGEFDIEAVQIEDTPIANFADVEYELYNPGDSVTMFPDNVVTSVEVAGIELKGTNEVGYAMSGPFVVNPAGTETDTIEVDVILPSGLYKGNNSGGLDPLTVTALFEKREIDNAGSPLGGWTTLAAFTKTLRTNTPQRFTLEANVTPGRYEVRGQRTNSKDEANTAQNLLRWDGLRAFLPSTKDYGEVTLLAVKARASNNLNDRSANRINVIGTRKLPIYDLDTETWSANTATRNPIWALFDVARASYGAGMEDIYFYFDELIALADKATDLDINFDFVFEQKISVWEAFKTCLRVLRAVPMLNGSELTAIRDEPQTIARAAYNKEQIVAGTFKHSVKLVEPGEFDGLEVTYVDQDTWTEETVLCLVDGEVGDNPEKMRLFGCTSRTIAYREGMYMRRCKLKLTESINFSTGLEGQIPNWNDAILVTHDVPNSWGQGGLLLDIANDDVTCTLNEPVDFSAGGAHKIAFRKKDGSVVAPITCTAGATPYEVILDTPLTAADFSFDAQKEPPGFYFGPATKEGKFCKITNLAPNRAGTVAVEAVIYVDVFVSDTEEPPALPVVNMPPKPPGAPEMDCNLVTLSPTPGNGQTALLSWAATNGALHYRVESSSNGTDWVLVEETTGLASIIPVEPEQPMFARVQAVGAAGAGPYCDAVENGEDAEEPVPVDGVGLEYPDIIGGTPISRTCYCKAQAVTATYCGFPEFNYKDGKFYKDIEFSGTRGGTVWDIPSAPEGNLCGGTYVGKFTVEWSGTASWDVATCKVTATGTQTVKEYNSSDVLFNTAITSLTGSETQLYGDPVTINCSNDQIRSDVEFKHQTNGECCVSLLDKLAQIADGFTEANSSNEDTAEAAMERAFDGEPDFDSLDYVVCNGDGSLPCCWSIWEKANGGSTFLVQKAKFKTVFENLQAGGASHVDFFVYRYNHDTGEHTLESTEELDSFASIDGEVEFEYELPLEQGFSFYIGGMKLSIL